MRSEFNLSDIKYLYVTHSLNVVLLSFIFKKMFYSCKNVFFCVLSHRKYNPKFHFPSHGFIINLYFISTIILVLLFYRLNVWSSNVLLWARARDTFHSTKVRMPGEGASEAQFKFILNILIPCLLLSTLLLSKKIVLIAWCSRIWYQLVQEHKNASSSCQDTLSSLLLPSPWQWRLRPGIDQSEPSPGDRRPIAGRALFWLRLRPRESESGDVTPWQSRSDVGDRDRAPTPVSPPSEPESFARQVKYLNSIITNAATSVWRSRLASCQLSDGVGVIIMCRQIEVKCENKLAATD